MNQISQPGKHSLSTDIGKQRTAEGQDRSSRLSCCTWTTQRNVSILLRIRLALASIKLALRDAQSDPVAIRCGDLVTQSVSFLCPSLSNNLSPPVHKGKLITYKSTGLLRPRQPRVNHTKRHRIAPHPELRTPLFRDRLRQSHHTRLRQRVIRLPRISMHTTATAHIHNRPRLPVLDPKERRRRPNQPERRSIVHPQNRIPLLVGDLVNDPVPSIARIVHDVVDLSTTEFCGLLYQYGDVVGVRDVSRNGDGAVGIGVVEGLGHRGGFVGVDVADYDFAAFVGEEAGCFGTDALAGAGDAGGGGLVRVLCDGVGAWDVHGGLTGQHTLGVVEVAGDLLCALSHAW